MAILGYFIDSIAGGLDIVLSMLVWILVARAILSWVSPDPFNPIVRFLHATTEPLLRHIRKYVPPLGGTVDLSPIVLLILVYMIQSFLVRTLHYYAALLVKG